MVYLRSTLLAHPQQHVCKESNANREGDTDGSVGTHRPSCGFQTFGLQYLLACDCSGPVATAHVLSQALYRSNENIR